MKQVKFNKDLLKEARKHNATVWVDKLSPDGSCFMASSTRTIGVRVRIYESAWDYEEARVFYNNHDLECFINHQIEEERLWYN